MAKRAQVLSASPDALATLGAQIRHTRQFGGSPSFQTMQAVRDNMAELIEACRDLTAQYDSMPDGPLGRGLTNGPFLRIRAALDRAGGAA